MKSDSTERSMQLLCRILYVLLWSAIAVVAVCLILQPHTTNFKLLAKQYYGVGPWSVALNMPQFWQSLIPALLTLLCTLTSLFMALGLVRRISRKTIFTPGTDRIFFLAAVLSLMQSVCTLCTLIFSSAPPLGLWAIQALWQTPSVQALSILLHSDQSTLIQTAGAYLIGALLLFALGILFRRATELKTENDLTI